MKTLISVIALVVSMSAFAGQKEVTIKGAAAEEIQALLQDQTTSNISCVSRIVPLCSLCEGGPLVTTCTLKVDSAHVTDVQPTQLAER